ncbi:ferritin family protein [Lagierella massiliensis]|uniref:ferritin family protein n=1 Tax=Lagierella massiliensis TaxID=1689303 RepID=UPI0006D76A5B|nr:ferritin family protein [Lagierella massiliensis]
MNREDFKKVIEFAIGEEEKSYDFYMKAADKIEDKLLHKTFVDLANEELEHKKFLEAYRDNEGESMSLSEPVDYEIAETLDAPELSVDMSFPDAIALAIKREEDAMLMYGALRDSAHEQEKKEVFTNLKNMEKLHKTRLEEMYINVGYREIW